LLVRSLLVVQITGLHGQSPHRSTEFQCRACCPSTFPNGWRVEPQRETQPDESWGQRHLTVEP